jgi:hypothetical protein
VPKKDDFAASQFLVRQQPSAATNDRDLLPRPESASDNFVAASIIVRGKVSTLVAALIGLFA